MKNEAYLEIVSSEDKGMIHIEGPNANVVLAWMRLTVCVARNLKIPLPLLLSVCEFLEDQLLRDMDQYCKIDLSNLRK